MINIRNQEDMKNKVIKYPETIIGANTSIGAGAVILPGMYQEMLQLLQVQLLLKMYHPTV